MLPSIKKNIFVIRIILLLFTGLSVSSFAGSADADIKKAIDTKAKEIIRCSPDGRNDSLLPVHAIAKLSKGSEIVFLPGRYEQIIINSDSVIISSETETPIEISLLIRGKNCILRNFCGRNVEACGDIIIINSAIGRLLLNSPSSKKNELTIYNTSMYGIYSSSLSNEWDINIKNCTIRGLQQPTQVILPPGAVPPSLEESAIIVMSRHTLEIQNSVITSNSFPFLFLLSGRQIKTKLILKDNNIFGKSGLGFVRANPNEKKNKQAILDLKDLRKIVSTTLQGENTTENIEFESNILGTFGYFMIKNPQLKNKGIIIEENPFFKKFSNGYTEEKPPQISRPFDEPVQPHPLPPDNPSKNDDKPPEKDVFAE